MQCGTRQHAEILAQELFPQQHHLSAVQWQAHRVSRVSKGEGQSGQAGSLTSLPSTPVLSREALKTVPSKSSTRVSLKPPRFALQIGVRRADTITTSSGDLVPGELVLYCSAPTTVPPLKSEQRQTQPKQHYRSRVRHSRARKPRGSATQQSYRRRGVACGVRACPCVVNLQWSPGAGGAAAPAGGRLYVASRPFNEDLF